jgi:EXPERA (EXPanded EBP superfamily)
MRTAETTSSFLKPHSSRSGQRVCIRKYLSLELQKRLTLLVNMAAIIPPSQPFVLDVGTAVSLAIAFSCMPAAQLLASVALPKNTSRTYQALFIWHAYDFLTHYMVEASFLYHCFFSYIELPVPTSDYPHPASRGLDHLAVIYNRSDRRYGPFYSQSVTGRMWQEYAKADRRWGSADLNVISIELLTCFVAAPAEMFVCYQIAKFTNASSETNKAAIKARIWFAAVAIATAELYGGFMTFAPEWLSGSTQLDTSNPMYLWLYLVFFNVLWVIVPLWVLHAGYKEIRAAFVEAAISPKKTR